MKTIKLLSLCVASSIALTACHQPESKQPSSNATPAASPAVAQAPAAASTSSTSETPVVGSGVSSNQTLALKQNIQRISADVPVTFIYDPKQGNQITVTADDNVQALIKISTDQGNLKIAQLPKSLQSKTPIQVTWGGTAPDAIDVAGSAKVILRQFKADLLTANIAGSGEIDADGQTKNLNLSISGSGSFVAPQLISEKATIQLTGSGNIVTQVTQEVSGNISGSGAVTISGHPKGQNLSKNGSAQVVYQ